MRMMETFYAKFSPVLLLCLVIATSHAIAENIDTEHWNKGSLPPKSGAISLFFVIPEPGAKTLHSTEKPKAKVSEETPTSSASPTPTSNDTTQATNDVSVPNTDPSITPSPVSEAKEPPKAAEDKPEKTTEKKSKKKKKKKNDEDAETPSPMDSSESSNKSAVVLTQKGEVTLVLTNLLTKDEVTLKQSAGNDFNPVLHVLPAGKYLVSAIRAELEGGQIGEAKFSEKSAKRILVRAKKISNAGLWTLRINSKGRIGMGIKRTPSKIRPTGDPDKYPFTSIITAKTGKEELNFKELLEELRDTAPVEQAEVQYFFRLDLYKNNMFGPFIASRVAAADEEFRQCYRDAIEQQPDLKGHALIKFLISKKRHRLKKVRITESTLNNRDMHDCILVNLKKLEYPAEKNMLGEIDMIFEPAQ
jgi:hypothetical protein